MDIKQLQYFVVSVDMGSFHAASEVLLTTQPNVSKIIKALESDLGMQLLIRDRNGVTVTPDGESIYRYAITVLQSMKNIEEYRKSQTHQHLSICSSHSNVMSHYLAHFQQNHPNIDLQIDYWEGNVEEMIRKIHRRDAEMGFAYISKRNMTPFKKLIASKGIQFIELSKLPLYVFVGSKSPYYNSYSISDREISKMKFVQFYEDQFSLNNHLGHLKVNNLMTGDNDFITYTNSDYFLVQMLKHSDYASIGSSLTPEKFHEFGIRAIPVDTDDLRVNFGYFKRRRDTLSPLAQDFIDEISTNLKKGNKKICNH